MTDTTDALLKIEYSLEPAEREAFDLYVKNNWPRLVGATPADVLEHTTDYDMFLAETEVFFEAHGDEFPDNEAPRAAAHVLIILGRELTVVNVTRVLMKAGLMPKRESDARRAYDPLPSLADLVAAAQHQPLTGMIVRELLRNLELGEDATTQEIELAIREALGSFITRTGRLLTPAELDSYVAERYDFSGLRPLPGHDGPGHTAGGPADCARCQLLRENAHWMAAEDPLS